jgi:hypothetical protein
VLRPYIRAHGAHRLCEALKTEARFVSVHEDANHDELNGRDLGKVLAVARLANELLVDAVCVLDGGSKGGVQLRGD